MYAITRKVLNFVAPLTFQTFITFPVETKLESTNTEICYFKSFPRRDVSTLDYKSNDYNDERATMIAIPIFMMLMIIE